MKKTVFTTILLLFVSTLTFASTFDGAWKGYVEGQYNMTATLKSEGGKLTGILALVDNNPKSENPDDSGYSPYVAAQMGKNTITEGKIEGETITFTCLFNGKPIVYKGTIVGEKLVLTTVFNAQTVKITLTKVKV